MIAKRIILCDLGNVLIEWNPSALLSKLIPDQQERQDYLSKIKFYEWNAKQDAGRCWVEAEQELISQFPHDEKLIMAYRNRYLETMGAVKTDVVDILKQLKSKGCTLYAASNWNSETFEITRPRMTFLDLFDGMHISGEIGVIKPDPRFFTSMMDRYGFKSEEAIFIDDNLENVSAAQKVGISSIHFHNANKLIDALKQMNITIK